MIDNELIINARRACIDLREALSQSWDGMPGKTLIDPKEARLLAWGLLHTACQVLSDDENSSDQVDEIIDQVGIAKSQLSAMDRRNKS